MSQDPEPPASPDAAARAGAAPAPESKPAGAESGTETNLISIEEFARCDLRVARVVAAERHPRADRLLKLQVDLGGETRQLVAGIAGSYRPEDLVGRLIVVVANLKPARLRGEVSQGMLLAASSGEVISLLAPDQPLPPGSQVR